MNRLMKLITKKDDSELIEQLHSAVQADDLERTRELLKRGARANGKGRQQNTSLHVGAKWGSVEVARLLLGCGASVKAKNELLQTPLHVAVASGRAALVELLLKHKADASARSKGAQTPLHVAFGSDRAGASQRSGDLVELLLRHKADVNARNEVGQTPLHVAAERSGPGLVGALLRRGAEVDAGDVTRRTALHVAAKWCNAEVVPVLLAHGADVNARDEKRCTPLHVAAECVATRFAEALLARGADVGARCIYSMTPLHFAAMNGAVEIARLVLERGAHVDARDDFQRAPLHMPDKLFAQRIELQNYFFYFPLHEADEREMLQVVELLLERGADVDARNLHRDTPLLMCRRTSGLELLLARGADAAARNEAGATLAHSLCQSVFDPNLPCEPGMITALFDLGLPGINELDADGETPFTGILRRLKDTRERHLDGAVVEVVRHVRRLIVLGADVSEKNHNTYYGCMQCNDEPFRRFRQCLEQKGFRDGEFTSECEAELDRLRRTRLFRPTVERYATLYDILFLESLVLHEIHKNANFRRIVESAGSFPIYSYLIKLQYQRGQAMAPLYEACQTAIHVLGRPLKMEALFVSRILQYLSVADAKNLCEATSVSVDQTSISDSS